MPAIWVPRTLAGRKPLGRGVDLHPALKRAASGVYVLRDGQSAAYDFVTGSKLDFGAAAASPAWSTGIGGQGLAFDGGDECYGGITTVSGAPAWMGCSFVLNNLSASQAGCGLGSSNPTFGAFMAFLFNLGSGKIMVQLRWSDGASATDIDGPSAVVGRIYHCAFVSRGANDHVLWVNGIPYRSSTSVTTGSSFVNMGIGCLRRAATSFQLTGQVHWAAYGANDPGEALLRGLSMDPYQYIFAPRRTRPVMWSDCPTFFQDFNQPSRQPLVPIPY